MKPRTNSKKQTTRKREQGVVRIIRKSNSLVEARYKSDIWETRIFTKMLMSIDKNDHDFKKYKIYLKDIVEDFGLKSNKEAYPLLRQGARKLMRKVFYIPYEVDGVERLFEAPILTGLDSAVTDGRAVTDDHLYIEVSFAPEMKPFLIQLKTQFTMYDVRNILKLPSTYSIRIYELLKQYEKIGKRKFEIKELKRIIGVIEELENIDGKKSFKDNYPLYGNFRQRVLLKAQKDLKKYTDIEFSFEPKKTGRRITALIFIITKNDPQQSVSNRKNKTDKKTISPEGKSVIIKENSSQQELIGKLYKQVAIWVTKDVVTSWVEMYPEDQIRKGITYTLEQLKKGKDINNVAGYLQKMVKTQNLTKPNQAKKEKEKARRAQIQAVVVKKQALELEYKRLSNEKYQQEKLIVDAILLEFPNSIDDLVEKTKQRPFSKYDKEKTIEENIADKFFGMAFRRTVMEVYSKRFIALNNKFDPKIAALKKHINQL